MTPAVGLDGAPSSGFTHSNTPNVHKLATVGMLAASNLHANPMTGTLLECRPFSSPKTRRRHSLGNDVLAGEAPIGQGSKHNDVATLQQSIVSKT